MNDNTMKPNEKPNQNPIHTTGHQWDGIEENDVPAPLWWLWVFYATIIFALVYVILFPAMPYINNFSHGLLGWSSRGELANDIKKNEAKRQQFTSQITDKPLSQIVANEDLFKFAKQAGASAYNVNCVQCHQSGAVGAIGYPNLNDDDWLWGGKLEDIEQTITHGIRFAGDSKTRDSQMPNYGRDKLLQDGQIIDVSAFVLSLSGQSAKRGDAGKGKALFAENCAACHGPNGAGNREFGAPAINDSIWLYGGKQSDIINSIANPHAGVMPAWGGRLDGATIKSLAIYIHSLGGGQ